MIVRANATEPAPFRRNIATSSVTSGPYWGLRVYGDSPHEIGLESLHDYCRTLVDVGERLKEVLVPTGTWWLNLGDTTAGSGGAGGDYNEGGSKDGQRKYRQGRPTIGLPRRTTQGDLFSGPSVDGWDHEHVRLANGNWCLVPQHVAMHLQGAGWILRKEIIWDKIDRRPEDLGHARRPGHSHETILMFARQMEGYKFYPDRLPPRQAVTVDILEALPVGTAGRQTKGARLHRIKGVSGWYGSDRKGLPVVESSDQVAESGGLILANNEEGSVWHIRAGRDENDDHPAVMPEAVVRRCIEVSTDVGDVVYDMFSGSDTTVDVANQMNRVGIGADLYAGAW